MTDRNLTLCCLVDGEAISNAFSRFSIPITDDDDEVPVTLNSFDEKKKLGPATRLSKVFPEDLPEETLHIFVRRPLLPQSAVGIIVKPERKVMCN
ncbi:hypothetical protein BGX24_004493 [Mortierella sp. AD032]|nr:hypothetical protein BGX24_004493 [Mortierella sp. AD032]